MIKVHQIKIWICELCLSGKGGICHVPECALCRRTAPDIEIPSELYEIIKTTEIQ